MKIRKSFIVSHEAMRKYHKTTQNGNYKKKKKNWMYTINTDAHKVAKC